MSNSVATVSYDPSLFTVKMPDRAPVLGFDVNAETFNWRDVMPSNYFSMEELTEMHDLVGGWPVYTPARVVIKPVYDPSEWEGKEIPASGLAPKIVICKKQNRFYLYSKYFSLIFLNVSISFLHDSLISVSETPFSICSL